MARPPVSVGAVHDNTAVPTPVLLAVRPVGAAAAPNGVAFAARSGPVPTAFVASTRMRCCTPFAIPL